MGAGGGRGRGSRGGGGQLDLRSSYKPLKGTNLMVVGGRRQFSMYILYIVQPVRRGGGGVRKRVIS